MPFNYAHYRFGAEQLARAPEPVRRVVGRFRGLYDVGLHGPDIFMCRGPVLRKLAREFHSQSGREFFGRVTRMLRLEDLGEGGLSYLYGVLTHYALDSVCHPFVNQKTREGPAYHVEIESEFDRFLLERDGKTPPCNQDLSRHIGFSRGEEVIAAKFYPSITAEQARSCTRTMGFLAKVLSTPEGPARDLLIGTLRITGDKLPRFFMTSGPNERCAHLNEPLFALYQRASEQFPVMLSQLQAHLKHNAPLGEEFDAVFG